MESDKDKSNPSQKSLSDRVNSDGTAKIRFDLETFVETQFLKCKNKENARKRFYELYPLPCAKNSLESSIETSVGGPVDGTAEKKFYRGKEVHSKYLQRGGRGVQGGGQSYQDCKGSLDRILLGDSTNVDFHNPKWNS